MTDLNSARAIFLTLIADLYDRVATEVPRTRIGHPLGGFQGAVLVREPEGRLAGVDDVPAAGEWHQDQQVGGGRGVHRVSSQGIEK